MFLSFFPKSKVFFEVAFHGNVDVRFFIFSGFLFPFIVFMKDLNEIVVTVTFYFIFCGMTVFFVGMFISNALSHHIRSSSLLSQFHVKVSKIGWKLGVRIWPVLEGIPSAATICWKVIVLKIGIPELLPYSWILEGSWGFESAWLWSFCIFLFQWSCFGLPYSLTVIWITPNCLLLVFYYNCPALFCWIRNLNQLTSFFSVWRWLPLMTFKLDHFHLKCCRWYLVDLPLYPR